MPAAPRWLLLIENIPQGFYRLDLETNTLEAYTFSGSSADFSGVATDGENFYLIGYALGGVTCGDPSNLNSPVHGVQGSPSFGWMPRIFGDQIYITRVSSPAGVFTGPVSSASMPLTVIPGTAGLQCIDVALNGKTLYYSLLEGGVGFINLVDGSSGSLPALGNSQRYCIAYANGNLYCGSGNRSNGLTCYPLDGSGPPAVVPGTEQLYVVAMIFNSQHQRLFIGSLMSDLGVASLNVYDVESGLTYYESTQGLSPVAFGMMGS